LRLHQYWLVETNSGGLKTSFDHETAFRV